MRAKPVVIISSTQNALRVPRKKLAELVQFLSRAEGVRVAAVDIAVVNSAEMTGVNRRFLDHRGDTDVISFDLTDQGGQGLSIQLVICGDVAVRQAPHHGLKPQHELMLYVIHGLLHMMGYEDTTIRGGARMHAREEELLKQFLRRE